MRPQYSAKFAFYEQLWHFYTSNRGRIRSRYKVPTIKFLAYNDPNDNPGAFLRRPQFEALEMYVFTKEFLHNHQMCEIFDDWRNRRGEFSDASYHAIDYKEETGQINMADLTTVPQTQMLFKQMKKYREDYPNYIFALATGLDKTILMVTCVFYEFLLARKYPKDKRFCHNALVFAPDKTVLQSLREMVLFDKTKVVPQEYARVLDADIKFHFLEGSRATLNTIDNSDCNIIISNTQKIVVKKKHKELTPADILFIQEDISSSGYGDNVPSNDDALWGSDNLIINQRLMKLCRLNNLGIYVDEAHHLFGTGLKKQLRSNAACTSLRSTINLLALHLRISGGSVVACFNYIGAAYVHNQVLPEVVYAYNLHKAICDGFLKDCDVQCFENMRSEEFLKAVVSRFWENYGGNTYEGLLPKLAIFVPSIDEAISEVQPAVEKVLVELGVPLFAVLVNTGDKKYTKEEDMRHFNNLDVVGTEGNRKQFLILVNKGHEGWNCRSLFGVALFRSPSSRIFVLQATMHCLQKITEEQQRATVFLSKDGFDSLNNELSKNFNVGVEDLKVIRKRNTQRYQVRVLSSPRKIKLRSSRREYELIEKAYNVPVDFGLSDMVLTKYEAGMYKKINIPGGISIKKTVVDEHKDNIRYSRFSLVGEVARYLNLSPVLVNRILGEAVGGVEQIIDLVNKCNRVIYDVLIPKIWNTLFDIKLNEKELILGITKNDTFDFMTGSDFDGDIHDGAAVCLGYDSHGRSF